MAFLDLGFGESPNSRATHGVDWHTKRSLKSICKAYGPNKEKQFEQKISSMQVNFNFDYNTTRLPYPDNYFSTVFSSHSLDGFGRSFAFHEAVRVLKKNGKIIIKSGANPSKIEKIVNILKKLKISHVSVVTRPGGFYIISGVK